MDKELEGFSGGHYGGFVNEGHTGPGFAGRGPKGDQRADDPIAERVSDRLKDDADVDATDITVDVKNGDVTLTGTVATRLEQRSAEDTVERTPGVREVEDHLRVQPQDAARSRTEKRQG